MPITRGERAAGHLTKVWRISCTPTWQEGQDVLSTDLPAYIESFEAFMVGRRPMYICSP